MEVDDSIESSTVSHNGEESAITTDRTIQPPKRKIAKKRTTHLRLQNHNLRTIPNMTTCKSVVVLYLYNNRIDRIQNLDALTSLTHLYLSHNNIKRMENLDKLESLQKLYIGFNKISVVEGLHSLTKLRELHLEQQRLPAEDCLAFDPRSIEALAPTLHVLNIRGCRVTALRPLAPLSLLSDLDCADNQISSLVDVKVALDGMASLARLAIKGNPVCDQHRYRDVVVENAPSLLQLDNMEVTATYRQFVNGRGTAASRRKSATPARPPVLSVSDDAVVRATSAGIRAVTSRTAAGALRSLAPPRHAFSQGSLVPARLRPRPGARPAKTSSTHRRVGNMLTLTSEQREAVRAPSGQSCAAPPAPPGGDLGWPADRPIRRETLPASPARAPRPDHVILRPSQSQPAAPTVTSGGGLSQLAAWREAREPGRDRQTAVLLRGTVSEDLPARFGVMAITSQ